MELKQLDIFKKKEKIDLNLISQYTLTHILTRLKSKLKL